MSGPPGIPAADLVPRATKTAAGFEEASDPVPRRLLPDSAEVLADGSLAIGGCAVADLAAAFGTPLFVYDEDHLRARCREAVARHCLGKPSGRR